MMELFVVCGRDLATAKEVRLAAKITYLSVGPKGDNLRETPKPLLFGSLLLVKRPGVADFAKVLVQRLRDNVEVLFFESLTPLQYKPDLWGIRAFGVRHWDKATDGGLPEESGEGRTLRPQIPGFILHIHRHVSGH